MRKFMVLILVFLLLAVGGYYGVRFYLDKYGYSEEKADLKSYFSMQGGGDAALCLGEELLADRGTMREGEVYIGLDTVHRYFEPRFFYDRGEGRLLYTTDDHTDWVMPGEKAVHTKEGAAALEVMPVYAEGEQVLISLSFLQRYVRMEYHIYKEPYRVQLYTEWPERDTARVMHPTMLRLRGGVKGPVLRALEEGEELEIQESLENWSRVKTEDCFTGYVENKELGEYKRTARSAPEDPSPEYVSFTRAEKICVAWHQVMSAAGREVLTEGLSRVEDKGSITAVSPTWFSVSSNEGEITSLANEDYVKAAHEQGLQVWALADNNINYLYDMDTSVFLSSETARQRACAELVELSARFGIDGINIDFEQIPQEMGECYLQFIRELHVATRAAGLVLSVDIPQAREYSAHYGWRELGVMCDYVIMMGYDEHYAGSPEAGSVASIGYVQEGLQALLDAGVPPEKLVNGVPFYTRIWKHAGGELTSEALGMQGAADFVERNGLTSVWNEETCQNYAEGEVDGTVCQVWLEDADSLGAKLSVMNAMGANGVACWKLGLEDKSAWEVIGRYMRGEIG